LIIIGQFFAAYDFAACDDTLVYVTTVVNSAENPRSHEAGLRSIKRLDAKQSTLVMPHFV